MRRSRRHRELPLPRGFKLEKREHWHDKFEREAEEHEEELRERVLQPSGGPAETRDNMTDEKRAIELHDLALSVVGAHGRPVVAGQLQCTSSGAGFC